MPQIFFGQQYTKKQIDSLQEQNFQCLRTMGRFDEIVVQNMELVKASQELDYEKGIAQGYYNIAFSLISLSNYKKSIEYMDLAVQHHFFTKDLKSNVRVYDIYGRNYINLGNYNKAIENFDKGIHLLKKNAGLNHPFLPSLYHNKAVAFEGLGNIDSTLSTMHRSFRIDSSLYNYSLFGYTLMAHFQLTNLKDIDSTKFYLDKAKDEIDNNGGTAYNRSQYYLAMGMLFEAKEEYHTALDYFLQAHTIIKQIKNVKETAVIYQLIAETYELLKDEKNAHKYLVKYTHLNDSINNIKITDLNFLMDKFEKDQKINARTEKEKIRDTIAIIIVSFNFILLCTLWYFKKKKKERLRLIDEKDSIIEEKALKVGKLKNNSMEHLMK